MNVVGASGLNGIFAHSGTSAATSTCGAAACITPDPAATGAWFYQDVPTTPGARYNLTFWYAPGTGTNFTELQVLWGAASTPLTTGGAGACSGDCVFDNQSVGSTSYTQFTVSNLLATSSSMRVEFLGRQVAATLGVDDVSLTPVSSPTSVPAMGPGVLAVLAVLLAAISWWMFGGRDRSNASPNA